jgi:hypothetical protein
MHQCWPRLGFHLGACVTTNLCGNGFVFKSNPMVLHGPRFALKSNLVSLQGLQGPAIIGLSMDVFTIVISNYYKLNINYYNNYYLMLDTRPIS